MILEIPIEFTFFLRVLYRRWYLILLPLVIVGGYLAYETATAPAAAPVNFTTVVRFSAAQSIDAIPNRDGDFQDVWLSSELTVKALTSWALTTSFKQEVAARVIEEGITFDPAVLPVAADHERSVGQLFITWNDPDQLEIIAAAALDVLRDDSQRYFPQFGDEPAQVTILDDIRINPVPVPIEDRFATLLQIGIAFAIGIGAAIVMESLDPNIRTANDLKRLGLEVIVSVPRE